MRRDELYDSSSDAGSRNQSDADAEEDAEVRARLNARLSSLLGLDLSPAEQPVPAQRSDAAGGPGQDDPNEQEEKQTEEFEFRLFSTSSKTNAPARVVLAASDDEEAEQGEGGFVAPRRSISYYLAGEPTSEQLQKYRVSAVAGEDIVLGARKRAWGLERPWRVIKITLPGNLSSPTGSDEKGNPAPISGDGEKADKRKRPGKKRRIAMRTKAKAEKEKRDAEEKQKVSKVEHLAEKKKRLNREKKLKRRAKEREKKLAANSQNGTQQAPEAADSDDGSESGSAA